MTRRWLARRYIRVLKRNRQLRTELKEAKTYSRVLWDANRGLSGQLYELGKPWPGEQ